MKTNTHRWVAVRAIQLLEASHEDPKLVELLKQYTPSLLDGADLPNVHSSPLIHQGARDHIFKMEPYADTNQDAKYYMVRKGLLLRRLPQPSRMCDIISRDDKLTTEWWETPYKADVLPRQSLPIRATSLACSVVDMLHMPDDDLIKFAPGGWKAGRPANAAAWARPEQAVITLLMLSHYLADACMPSHCDARSLRDENGVSLHDAMEQHWETQLGDRFTERYDTWDRLAHQVVGAPSPFNVAVTGPLPPIRTTNESLWTYVVYMCRAAFAFSAIVTPTSKYPYGQATPAERMHDWHAAIESVPHDEAVIHDAVLHTAIVWRHVWAAATVPHATAAVHMETPKTTVPHTTA